MNNKGFTIVEVLGVIVLISVVVIVMLSNVRSSMAIGKENAYKVMKNNIVSVSYDYISECEQGLISCNFSFKENNTFQASVLESSGYFSKLESPVDGKYLGNCLIITAKKDNGAMVVDLQDNCY